MLMVMKQSEPTVRPKIVKTEIPVMPSFVFVILSLFRRTDKQGSQTREKRNM